MAEFIERRDGYPRFILGNSMVENVWLYIDSETDSSNLWIHGSDPELIFLTDGASKGVMQILNTIIRGAGDGVMFREDQLSSLLLLFDCRSCAFFFPIFPFHPKFIFATMWGWGVGCGALLFCDYLSY